VVASSSASAPAPPTSLSWLKPAAAPVGWRELTSSSHATVIWFPPTLKPIESDPGSVSAAAIDRGGTYLAYLNAGPPSGPEQLSTWPSFRIAHLRGEGDHAVHEDAHASGLTFRGSHGACVIDDYVTHEESHHYREIACFAQGATSASVLVAAVLVSSWAAYGPALERAIDAWEVH
jgi:hypothetical protein